MKNIILVIMATGIGSRFEGRGVLERISRVTNA